MKILLFQAKISFQQFKRPWDLLLFLFFVFIAWLYGIGVAFLSNQSLLGEIDLNIPDLYQLVFITFPLLIIFRLFSPTYKRLKQIYPRYFPLDRIHFYVFSVLEDLMSSFVFCVFIFIVACTFYLKEGQFFFFQKSSLFFITSYLIRRNLQYLIDFRLKNRPSLMILTLAVCSIYISSYFVNHFYLASLSTLFLSLVLGYFQEISILESTDSQIKDTKNTQNIFFKLYLNNPKVRFTFLIGFGFKIFVILMNVITFQMKGIYIIKFNTLLWTFFSPIILFNYIFNNMWGFWRNCWGNIELRTGDYWKGVTWGLQRLLFPLLIDFVITIILVFLLSESIKIFICFYLASVAILIAFSFLWSTLFPIKLEKVFQMKGTSSPISFAFSGLVVLLLAYFRESSWFYIISPLLIILAFWIGYKLYPDKKYNLINKLFK